MSNQIQAGRYKATVIAASVGESEKAKTPGVFLEFKTDAGEIRGTLWLTETQYTKRDGTTTTPLEESINTLRRCFGFNDDFSTLAQQVEGKECSITVEYEADREDPTKEWPRVKWINPVQRALPTAEKSVLARLTQQAKTIARPADAPAPQKVAAKPAPVASGDVPF